jgi:DNA-binding IclR family transcriptional regulator
MLLQQVAAAGEAVSNGDLVGMTGLPKATVSRITTQLLAAGLLRHEPRGDRFKLGPGVLALSSAFLEGLDVRSLIRTHLRELTEEIGASMHLGIRDGLDMVVIDTLRPRSAAVVTRLDVGSRLGIASSAMGRAWMAGLDGAERATVVKALKQNSGSAWTANAAAVTNAADAIERTGFCTSLGEWTADVNALGTFLRWPDGELYGISCGGPAYRLPQALLTGSIAQRMAVALRNLCEETGAVCPVTLIPKPSAPRRAPRPTSKIPS